MTKRLLVMAGGTGGHVFPGIAVAKHLEQKGWAIHWIGTADRMEADLVPLHGFDISFIDISGVRGNGLKRLCAAPFRILKSVLQARKVMQDFKPDVVLGMGGFASGPGGVAAWLQGIPVVLHEQNAAAGLTNRLLAKIAKRVLMAFPGAFTQGQLVGNPVREDVLALHQQVRVKQDKLTVLVVGGSLGAKVLNDTLPAALALLPQDKICVRHQVGKNNTAKVSSAYQAAGVSAEILIADFIDDMAQAYAQADVVVCRAGALTVSEVAVAGLPAIFIPLPHAVDDHQTKNAQSLVAAGGAVLIPQPQFNAADLAKLLQQWIDDESRLVAMSEAAKTAAILDATEQVAMACSALSEER
ncbi:undecaprenyldiphospho-muramoylpentapeptide beta-N-acetylglucosaminyltransferase [Moritella sp. F3]|uniref:undecaprenyldiphospho-muramoylpentapeptide beta-N-acetylglucosaminyltransferase n=1 Tax=Moritella sp. F3 TaxID=2718882 RepID=UPI0018E1B215|nr:undecaprenyldiphospho-muramoylpentapeptide beta-N-acetylglucosaminyltransferase [Moritella sp. F3]